MQVILPLFFSAKATISSSVTPFSSGSVVLMYTLWVVGMASSITCRESRLAKGSPPVNTKSHSGVMASMVRMLSQMASALKPVMSAYSFLLIQNGQLLPQS